MEEKELKYTGRLGQTFIYLIKHLRMFIFRNDWKVLPMAALIAGLVTMVVGKGIFRTMEGTLQGTFALTCVCIWNGFFNSIQIICRERSIVKREHRAGLHITSYVASHLIYQMLLCLAQSAITIIVLKSAGVYFPDSGLLDSSFEAEFFITLFLITYCADMLALMVSSIVHTTTTAMTVMPFLLIVQLVFAGYFEIPAALSDLTDLMISKWGVRALSAIGRYNDLPAVLIWHRMRSAGDVDFGGVMTLRQIMDLIEENNMRDKILSELGRASQNANYVSTADNLLKCWGYLIIFSIVYALIAVIFLEFIDRDKR